MPEFKRPRDCDTGTCVEVAVTPDYVMIRHSDMPEKRIMFTTQEWHTFIVGVHNGEFELPMAE